MAQDRLDIGIRLIEIKGDGADRRYAETPIPLAEGQSCTIGRKGSKAANICAVFINGDDAADPVVSSIHATVRRVQGRWEVSDGVPGGKASVNGIWQNNHRVDYAVLQEHGDKVVLRTQIPTPEKPDTPTQYMAIECRDLITPPSGERQTQRLQDAIETNHEQIKAVAAETRQQTEQLAVLSEGIESTKKGLQILIWVSENPWAVLVGGAVTVVVVIPLVVTLAIGKFFILGDGMDRVFPKPNLEQKQ